VLLPFVAVAAVPAAAAAAVVASLKYTKGHVLMVIVLTKSRVALQYKYRITTK
jgi:hypothetical protein